MNPSSIRRLRWFWLAAAALCGLAMLSIPQQGRILDLRFWYTGQDAIDYLASLQGESRGRYINHEWLDFGFMGFYSLALAGFWRGARHLRLLPWFPGLMDFIETGQIVAILYRPESGPWLASTLAMSTPVKYVFFYGVIAAIVLDRLRKP